MRNAWSFRIDPKRWVALPASEAWTGNARTQWIEQAVVVGALGLVGQDVPTSEVRALMSHLADAPRGPESAVFIPVAEPAPVLVHMVTDTPAAIGAAREQWLAAAPQTRAVEPTELDDTVLADAMRVARVDEDPQGAVFYSVAFVGTTADRGVLWHGSTRHPLVAGQLMSMGAEVFATVAPRV